MSLGKPPESLTQLLTTLCEDPRNLVFVITGREKDELDGALGDIKVSSVDGDEGVSCLPRPFLRYKDLFYGSYPIYNSNTREAC